MTVNRTPRRRRAGLLGAERSPGWGAKKGAADWLHATPLIGRFKMKAGGSRTRSPTRKRQVAVRPLALRRLERLEAGYRDLTFRLERLQQTLDTALANGELTLKTVDPESLRGFEAHRLREAGRRLQAEMKSLRVARVVDAKGRRVRKNVPQDMREGAGCDL